MNKTNKKVKQLKDKNKKLTEKWKRALADYQNLEKRIEKEKQAFVKFSTASLMDKLLAVVDDLERAEKHLKDKGLSIAVKQFKTVLQSEGIEEIKAQGKKFDPEKMDCVSMAEGKKNIVTTICQKGYKLNDKILRPAKVEVGKGK